MTEVSTSTNWRIYTIHKEDKNERWWFYSCHLFLYYEFPYQTFIRCQILCSVQFSRSVVSDSLRLHESQHTRPPCPSPILEFYSNSCPLSRWCHPTISSSVTPFSSCLQSFPASGSFPMSQFFTSGGQSIGVSASASVLSNWFPLGWTGWIFLLSKGLSRVFSSSVLHLLYGPILESVHTYWKNHSFD